MGGGQNRDGSGGSPVLTGWAERQRLLERARTSTATPDGLTALQAYLRPMIAGNAPLPATGTSAEPALARAYIGGVTGASRYQLDQVITKEGLVTAVAKSPCRVP
jgi:hypothetical protein